MSDNEFPQLHVYNARGALAEFLRGQAGWRAEKAEGWPEDRRNATSSDALFELADWVMALPGSDERLHRLAAYHLGDDVFLAGELPSRLAGRYGFDSEPDPDGFIDEFLHLLFEEDKSRSEDGTYDGA
jgi:hypothetical protein